MHNRLSPPHAFGIIALVALLIVLVQMGLMRIAVDKLGISPAQGMLLLSLSIIGSLINLPLMRIEAQPPDPEQKPLIPNRLLNLPDLPFTGQTLIAVNVGGCLAPLLFSISLVSQHLLPPSQLLLAIALVSAICYISSRPLPGIGIGMPPLIAPVAAAVIAISINQEMAAQLAYISGVCGVLIGADLLRLRDIAAMGAPIASIGGAGTFDGIFLTGLVAVLLT